MMAGKVFKTSLKLEGTHLEGFCNERHSDDALYIILYRQNSTSNR